MCLSLFIFHPSGEHRTNDIWEMHKDAGHGSGKVEARAGAGCGRSQQAFCGVCTCGDKAFKSPLDFLFGLWA